MPYQHPVQPVGALDVLGQIGHQVDGPQQHGLVLPAAEAPVGPDQALEGVHVVGDGVDRAVDVEVRRLGHRHGPLQHPTGMRAEGRQGVASVHHARRRGHAGRRRRLPTAHRPRRCPPRSRCRGARRGPGPGPATAGRAPRACADARRAGRAARGCPSPAPRPAPRPRRRRSSSRWALRQPLVPPRGQPPRQPVTAEVTGDRVRPAQTLDGGVHALHLLAHQRRHQVPERLPVTVREDRPLGLAVVGQHDDPVAPRARSRRGWSAASVRSSPSSAASDSGRNMPAWCAISS